MGEHIDTALWWLGAIVAVGGALGLALLLLSGLIGIAIMQSFERLRKLKEIRSILRDIEAWKRAGSPKLPGETSYWERGR